jgi:5-methylcytosine-specific restriction enzyme subunit McrC
MQGMIRHYVENKENLNVIRGRLRVEQQFKLNFAHKERVFCQYDELSTDNTHNQVIKYVLRLLLKKATGTMARNWVVELLMRFDPISDVYADIQMLDSLTFNRSTSRYEPIFEQCRWFLQGLHPDVVVGEHSCLSLLFDMNKLFEAYVASVFRKMAWAAGLRMREQGPQKYMMRRLDNDDQAFLMKPDMAFLDTDNNIVSIADAKWKMLDEREKKLGISQGDLYQMNSYAARYGVKCLAIVYPKQQHLTNRVNLIIQGTSASLEVIPLDVISDSWPKNTLLTGFMQ